LWDWTWLPSCITKDTIGTESGSEGGGDCGFAPGALKPLASDIVVDSMIVRSPGRRLQRDKQNSLARTAIHQTNRWRTFRHGPFGDVKKKIALGALKAKAEWRKAFHTEADQHINLSIAEVKRGNFDQPESLTDTGQQHGRAALVASGKERQDPGTIRMLLCWEAKNGPQ